MNRAAWFLVLLLVICRPLWAQVAAPDAAVPDTLKNAADLTGQSDQVAQLVTAETQKLVNDSDAASQGMARDWLIDQSAGSDAYRDAYDAAVNNEFTTALKDSKTSVRTRVNIAIVTDGICKTSKNLDLLPTTMTLLGDSSDAIVLWAERAAGSELVTMLNTPNAAAADRKALLKAMEDAAVRHCSTLLLGGFIVEEVYKAINPSFMLGANPQGEALGDLVNTNLALQKGRLDLYAMGMPESPYVDTYASDFLLDPATWATMNPQQQLQAVQQAGDLICKAALLVLQGNVTAAQMSELTRTAGREGDYVDALATKVLNNSNLVAAAKDVEGLGVASQPTAIRQACHKMEDALQAAFPGFQPAPDFAHPAAGAAGQ